MTPAPRSRPAAAGSTDARVIELDTSTQRLLLAAIEVFTERGFEKAGVAEIARRAGFTTGAIYSRWPGKHEMLVDAVDHVASHHLLHLLGGSQLSAPDVLASLGADLVVTDDEAGRALLLEAFATARRDPDFRAMLHRRLADERSRLGAVIDQGRAEGVVDPELTNDAIVTLCQAIGLGFVLLRAAGQELPAADEWNRLVERLIAAVAPPPTA